MRGDKLLFWRSRRPRERLRRPLAILLSPHTPFLLALLLLAHLTVLVSATINYTFDKQDSKHVGYWVDEKASRVTKLTLDADHYWVTSSTFQAACKVGQYFNNDCPMPTRCIKELITTSSHDPRYKPYREVVEYNDGRRETCFNDEHPPTPFPSTPFTPSSCMPMTITLAPYYANTAPDVQGPSRYANLGCRPLYDDNNGSGWNPKNVIYAALGTAIGATQTAAAAGLKLVETRIVTQNEIPSRTRTGDDNSRGNNDDDDVPLLGGASIYTDENGQLQISDGPTSTGTRTSTSTYSTTMVTITTSTHPPNLSQPDFPPFTHPTVTTQSVPGVPPGQDQLVGEGGDVQATGLEFTIISTGTWFSSRSSSVGGQGMQQTGLEAAPDPDSTNTDSGSTSSKFDPMETATAAATGRSTRTSKDTGTGTNTPTGTPTGADTPTGTDTNTDNTPTTDTDTSNSNSNPTPTPTDTDSPTDTQDTDTDTDPEKQQEDGDSRTTKYDEKKNKKWITAAVVMGSITGGIFFTCLAGWWWCVFSRRRWYIRRAVLRRIERRRRSPSPSSSAGQSGSASGSTSGAGGAGIAYLRSSALTKLIRPLAVFLTSMADMAGLTGLTGQLGRINLFNLLRDKGGAKIRYGPDSQGQGQDEEEGRISQENPFQDPSPWQQQHQGVGHGNGLFENDCRDCEKEKRKELKRKTGTQLSIIDEVTEPGSKRGSGVESTVSEIEKVEEEVEEEVEKAVEGRDSWPASPGLSPGRLLESPSEEECAGSCKSGEEVVNVYIKRGSGTGSLGGSSSEKVAEEAEEKRGGLKKGTQLLIIDESNRAGE